MLVISAQQMKALGQAALKNFEDEMVVHSKKFSPRLCEVLGDEQLREAIRRAIGRAGEYGFDLRGPVRLYIEMMFLYGSSFDTDPQYPWAAQALRSSEPQMQRAEQPKNYRLSGKSLRARGCEHTSSAKRFGDYRATATRRRACRK
jgi:hypothetical protein